MEQRSGEKIKNGSLAIAEGQNDGHSETESYHLTDDSDSEVEKQSLQGEDSPIQKPAEEKLLLSKRPEAINQD